MSEYKPTSSIERDPWKALHYIGLLTTSCVVDGKGTPTHTLEVINSILREYMEDDPAVHPDIDSVLRIAKRQMEQAHREKPSGGDAAREGK